MYVSERAKRIIYNPDTREMMMEYYLRTGEDFPSFNYDDWHTIDDWYSKLTSELERLRKEKTAET